jgi:hypothetical protein
MEKAVKFSCGCILSNGMLAYVSGNMVVFPKINKMEDLAMHCWTRRSLASSLASLGFLILFSVRLRRYMENYCRGVTARGVRSTSREVEPGILSKSNIQWVIV